MTPAEIRALVVKLDSRNSADRESIWLRLKPLGESIVSYLAEGYLQMKRLEGRRSCVFHSICFARTSEAAFQLGMIALRDRATLVRYRACQLLAYSLRSDAIPHLSALLEHRDKLTVEDAKAAIDAIKNQNHHYFVDRTHSGKSFWEVSPPAPYG